VKVKTETRCYVSGCW